MSFYDSTLLIHYLDFYHQYVSIGGNTSHYIYMCRELAFVFKGIYDRRRSSCVYVIILYCCNYRLDL